MCYVAEQNKMHPSPLPSEIDANNYNILILDSFGLSAVFRNYILLV